MMENLIKDELKKNCVKDNLSGRFDKLTYRFHKGLSKHYIKSSLVGSYGYIYVSIGNAENLNIYFNSLPIFSTNGGYNSLISLKFVSGDYIEIEGDADFLTVQIYGGEFESSVRDKVLYNSGVYLEDCGGVFMEYKYETFEEGKESFSYQGIIDAIDLVEFKNGSSVQMAKLVKDDKLYLYTNIDNYATQYLCNITYEKAVLIPGFGEYLVCVLYINAGKVYMIGLTKDMAISDIVAIETSESVRNICSVSSNVITPAFMVEFSNGTTGLYYYNNSGFIEILNTKSKKQDICIIGNYIYLIYKDNYDQMIKKYSLDKTYYKVTPILQRRIILADSIMIYDKCMMITYNYMERFVNIEDL